MLRRKTSPPPVSALDRLSTSVLAHVLGFVHVIEVAKLATKLRNRHFALAGKTARLNTTRLVFDTQWGLLLANDFRLGWMANELPRLFAARHINTVIITSLAALCRPFLRCVVAAFPGIHTVRVSCATKEVGPLFTLPRLEELRMLRVPPEPNAMFNWSPYDANFYISIRSPTLRTLAIDDEDIILNNWMPHASRQNIETLSCIASNYDGLRRFCRSAPRLKHLHLTLNKYTAPEAGKIFSILAEVAQGLLSLHLTFPVPGTTELSVEVLEGLFPLRRLQSLRVGPENAVAWSGKGSDTVSRMIAQWPDLTTLEVSASIDSEFALLRRVRV